MANTDITNAVREELELLNIDQVAELLKLRKSWLYDEVEARRFPHLRLGRQLRFRASEVRAYLAGEWQPEPEDAPQMPTAPGRGRPRKN